MVQLGRTGPSYMWWEHISWFKNNEVTSCMSTCPRAMVAYPIVHVCWVCVESKIVKFHFWVRSDTAVLTFTLCFLWFPLHPLSLPRFFFVICWAFTRLHFGGKHFYGKAFRIVGLDGRRVTDGWVVEQEFHTQLGPTLHGFSSFLRPLWLKHANSGKLV